MSVKDQIRILCATLNISRAELAKRLNMKPQSLNDKLTRNTLTPDDLKAIANAVECEYIGAFVLKDGQRIEY